MRNGNMLRTKFTFRLIFHTENYILSDPDLKSDVDASYLSHKEKYEEAIRRVVVILKRIEKLQSEGHNIEDVHKYNISIPQQFDLI